ncbi:integral membrane protein [Streptomyces sp. Mg1]|nr:integral membrane protein [Streptomyces sp. Mg1]
MADGAVGPAVRARLLADPRPTGPHGRRDDRRPLRRRTPPVRARGRAAERRGLRADPGRRADVPLQQPRRAADPAAHRHRVLRPARPRRGAHQVARPGRRRDRSRLPHQDAPGVRHPAAARPALRRLRAHPAAPAARPAAARRARHGGGRRLVGGDRRALAGRLPPVHRRLPEQLLPGADPRLQRPRPHQRRRGRQRRRRRPPRGRSRRGRWGRWGRRLGRDRDRPALLGQHRRSDLLAAAGGPDHAGGRSGHHLAGRRATDSVESMARAAFLAWGGCLLITGLIFSYMQGIFHEYYTVALAPFVAALVGMGVAVLWEERGGLAASLTLSATVALTAWWSYVLLGRASGYLPWLRWTVLAAGLLAAAGLLIGSRWRPGSRTGGRLLLGAAALGVGAALAGPFAYCLTTVDSGRSGSIVTAGPAVAGGVGGPGGMRFKRAGAEGFRGGFPGGPQGATQGAPQGGFPGGAQGGLQGGIPGGFPKSGQTGAAPGGPGVPGAAGGAGGRGARSAMGGPGGGLLNGTKASAEATAALRANAGGYTWAAAAVGAQNAASYQLASGEPVMPIGGFNGSDPSPTLAKFQEYVKAGKIHYFIGQNDGGTGAEGGQGARGGAGGPGGPGGGTSSAIAEWVKAGFKATTIGGATFYDLTAPVSGTS